MFTWRMRSRIATAAKGCGLSLNLGGLWRTGLQKYIAEETMKEWKARSNVENILKSTKQDLRDL